MSFAEDIKNEIVSLPLNGENEKIAFLSAFVRTSGSVVSRGGKLGFEIVTENERTAEYVCTLTGEFGVKLDVIGAELDAKSGKDKLSFGAVEKEAENLLCRMGILSEDKDGASLNFGIDENLTDTEEKCAAYINGAFLGGGSCTLPEEETYSRTGYHFEVVFSNKLTAGDFCELLCGFEVLAKLVARKDSAVVYVKSKEVISDLLNAMGLTKSLARLNKIVEFKDKSNNDNRVNNCSVSNIDKTVTASVAQIRAIETIAQTVGLQSLGVNLFEVAEARLADKNASMQELADRLNISKSCINHRMRKICEIASHLA